LRILCYHGISLADGSAWKPMLFMRSETFEARLAILQRMGLPVLPLDDALERLYQGTLPDNAVAITIDDGFAATFEQAVPALRRRQLPATIYVTSYYVEKEQPIFELVVRYIQWKMGSSTLVDLRQLGIDPARDAAALDGAVLEEIIAHGKRLPAESDRESLSRALAAQVGFDYPALVDSRLLALARPSQVAQAAHDGIDIQLHTRRHRFPVVEGVAKAEIEDNRRDLQQMVDAPLEHFCYPSGHWHPSQWPWLEELGVKSATTCESGLNFADTPRFALKRFLDSEALSDLEFEAELSGFSEVLRRGRRFIRP
jgi:peptidoglycan/xylan/chitin deacetylase (PgdA/CDA1 family)